MSNPAEKARAAVMAAAGSYASAAGVAGEVTGRKDVADRLDRSLSAAVYPSFGLSTTGPAALPPAPAATLHYASAGAAAAAVASAVIARRPTTTGVDINTALPRSCSFFVPGSAEKASPAAMLAAGSCVSAAAGTVEGVQGTLTAHASATGAGMSSETRALLPSSVTGSDREPLTTEEEEARAATSSNIAIAAREAGKVRRETFDRSLSPAELASCTHVIKEHRKLGMVLGMTIGAAGGSAIGTAGGPAAPVTIFIAGGVGGLLGCGVGYGVGSYTGYRAVAAMKDKAYIKWEARQSKEVVEKFREIFFDAPELAVCADSTFDCPIEHAVRDSCVDEFGIKTPHVFEFSQIQAYVTTRRKCPVSGQALTVTTLKTDYERMGRISEAYQTFITQKAADATLPACFSEGLSKLRDNMLAKRDDFRDRQKTTFEGHIKAGRMTGPEMDWHMFQITRHLYARELAMMEV